MHKYNPNGELVAPWEDGLWSVTTILDIRRKRGLEEWRRRVGDEEADRRANESASRGGDVHALIEELGWQDIAQFNMGDTFIDHAVNAFFRWKQAYRPTIVAQEAFIYSNQYKYAGTADLICYLNKQLWIVDFKTSSRLHPEYGLQLAAYRQGWYEMTGHRPQTAVLQLGVNTARGWKWQPYNEPLKPFLAHKIVFDWQIKHEPLKKPGEALVWDSVI